MCWVFQREKPKRIGQMDKARGKTARIGSRGMMGNGETPGMELMAPGMGWWRIGLAMWKERKNHFRLTNQQKLCDVPRNGQNPFRGIKSPGAAAAAAIARPQSPPYFGWALLKRIGRPKRLAALKSRQKAVRWRQKAIVLHIFWPKMRTVGQIPFYVLWIKHTARRPPSAFFGTFLVCQIYCILGRRRGGWITMADEEAANWLSFWH